MHSGALSVSSKAFSTMSALEQQQHTGCILLWTKSQIWKSVSQQKYDNSNPSSNIHQGWQTNALKFEDQQTYLNVIFNKRLTWQGKKKQLNILRKLAGTE